MQNGKQCGVWGWGIWTLLAVSVWGQDPIEAPLEKVKQAPAGPEGAAERAWLIGVLTPQMSSERDVRLMEERVAKMSPKQLERSIALQRRKLRQRREAQQAGQARREQQRAQVKNQELQILGAMAAQQNQFRDGFVAGVWAGQRRSRWDPFWPGVTWGPNIAYRGTRACRPRYRPWCGLPRTQIVESVSTTRPQSDEPRVYYDGLRTRYGVPSGPLIQGGQNGIRRP